MKQNEIKRRATEVRSLLAARRYDEAFVRLHSLAGDLLAFELGDEVTSMRRTYRYMLEYALRGSADPSRRQLLESMDERASMILDVLTVIGMSSETPTLYYNVKRYEDMQAQSLTALIDQYVRQYDAMSPLIDQTDDTASATLELERLASRIFNRLWVTLPLTQGECDAISAAVDSQSLPRYFKILLLSALAMSLNEFFDAAKLMLLLDVYERAGNEHVAVTALVGLLMAMNRHRERVDASRQIADRIASLRETTSWTADVHTVYLEFIRTRDTEQIENTFKNDIAPKISKITPDIKRSFDAASDSDADFNPEWAELLDKSGISDKLKELNEMQEQGSDVMMSTFKMLKTYPFFNEISNWFLPFYDSHSSLTSLDKDLMPIVEMMTSSPMLCDSDKYSLVFSIKTMPESQKRMMASQMSGLREYSEEARLSELVTANTTRRQIANRYIQCLYRFFKLFRRSGEFADPFDGTFNLMRVGQLRADLSDADSLRLIGEFYFAHRQWEDALAVMSLLEQTDGRTAELYQKMGYCCQKINRESDALTYYKRAELLAPDSRWLCKRIARSYRALHQPDKAIEYYKRLDVMTPDDFNTTMALGSLYVETADYEAALQMLHKAEFIKPSSARPWRPIAWVATMTGDLAKARSYYEKIEASGADETDCLNIGHLCLLEGNVKDAVAHYRTAMTLGAKGVEAFLTELAADSDMLVERGVPGDLLAILPDLIRMQESDG